MLPTMTEISTDDVFSINKFKIRIIRTIVSTYHAKDYNCRCSHSGHHE